MYSFFAVYDDEGGWLIALRSYHLHGSLYHNTFAQAGPFYYEVWSLVYSVAGLPVNWDTGRLMTLIVWIAASLLMGIAIWILTRRLLLGLLAEVVSFLVLFLLAGVAMEAAGLAHLMGAAVLLGVALFVRGRRCVGMGIMGAASTALFFTKINIGVFIIASLVAAVAIYWPSQQWVTTRRITVAIGLLVLPILLMAQTLREPTAWHYCVLELIYLVGLVGILLTKKIPVGALAVREILVGVGAAIGSTILIALGVLVNGTSLPQFINGAIFGPRGLTKSVIIPLPISGHDVVVAIISSVLAVLVAVYTVRRGHRPPWLNSIGAGYLRFALGIWILLTISEGFFPGWSPRGLVVVPTVTLAIPGESFLLAAPFVWIAALGTRDNDDSAFSFARVAICLMGVLGCLEGFPVAGSQMLWASLTLVPVGVICITDGLSMVSPHDNGLRRVVSGVFELPVGSLVAMALLLFLVFGNVGEVLSSWRGTYYANKPVRLLGAQRVRLPRAQIKELSAVTLFLERNCSTYWSLPGLNSFYFLSGETPPTDLNSTQAWWNAFSVHQQDRVLARLRQTPRLCLIEDPYFYVPYQTYGNSHVVGTQLVRYIEKDFVLVKTINAHYRLFVRGHAPTRP